MKRRIVGMDPYSTDGVSLVERNYTPLGVSLVNPAAVAKKDPQDLVELAREIKLADTFVYSSACNKLALIAEQMKFLQQQAKQVLLDAKMDSQLHHAACNFHKIPGKVYYLYTRESGQSYFSMLSPEEWETSGSIPHTFVGAYRLEPDQSWTPISKLEQRDEQMQMLHKVLQSSDLAEICYEPMNTS